MKFSHTIFYIKDIPTTLDFFEKAFGLIPSFLHESGAYAELNTQGVTLAFANEELGHMNLPNGFQKNNPAHPPQACEITFTTSNCQQAYIQALHAGAASLSPPILKPWGQTIAYIRAPSGILIALAST